MRWRPISTAPKDQIILLAQPPFNPHEHQWLVMQGRWIEVPHTNDVTQWLTDGKKTPNPKVHPQWFGVYPGIMQHDHVSFCGHSYEARPTVIHPSHWMPLPKPPTGKFEWPKE